MSSHLSKFQRTCKTCGKEYESKSAKWSHYCSLKCLNGVDIKERFWNFVLKTESTDSCWLWQGAMKKDGYASFNGRNAHRSCWLINVGEIPPGLAVLHRCDNRRCVNPSHLFIGTLDDNNKDRAAKGRSKPCRGERSNMAKLTAEKVLAIRTERANGAALKDLATKYSVSFQLISLIATRKVWTHI